VGITQVGERSRGAGITLFGGRSRVKEKKHGSRIAGGVLTIIASCLLFVAGAISLAFNASWAIFIGLFCMIGAAFGLVGGILTLTRRLFALAIIGTVLAMVGGILSFIWVIGFPIFLLSLLGLIFTSVAVHDFQVP
jgi:lysylphosphatidylglycerol synthetase-like protein (DUF2156 family)